MLHLTDLLPHPALSWFAGIPQLCLEEEEEEEDWLAEDVQMCLQRNASAQKMLED